jgi:hypothetical protein
MCKVLLLVASLTLFSVPFSDVQAKNPKVPDIRALLPGSVLCYLEKGAGIGQYSVGGEYTSIGNGGGHGTYTIVAPNHVHIDFDSGGAYKDIVFIRQSGDLYSLKVSGRHPDVARYAGDIYGRRYWDQTGVVKIAPNPSDCPPN